MSVRAWLKRSSVIVVAGLSMVMIGTATAQATIVLGGDTSSLYAAKDDGTGATTWVIRPTGSTRQLTADSEYVYYGRLVSGGGVGRVKVDGSGRNDSFVAGGGVSLGVAVDADYIYWTNSNVSGVPTIGRANLDGTAVNQSFITLTTGNGANAIALDGTYIYWSANAGVGRANLNGTSPNESFISGTAGGFGVSVNSTHVFWANNGNSTGTTIGRANLNGSSPNQSFISGLSAPGYTYVDSTYLYWSNSGAQAIGRAKLDGGDPDLTWLPTPSGSPFAPWGFTFAQVGKTVTFDANGGTGTMTNQLSPFPANLKPNTFTHSGHTFAGWNTQADGGGTPYPNLAEFPFTAATATLYAQWAVAVSRPLTYDGNGSTGGSAPGASSHDAGTKVTVAANTGELTKTGYTFAGWNTRADGAGTSYSPGDTFEMPDAAVTLYARWTANGGGGAKSEQTSVDACVTVPGSVRRTGATRVMSPTCETNIGQRIAVRILGRAQAAVLRGDVRPAASARIACRVNGKLRSAEKAGARYGAGYRYCPRGTTMLVTRNVKKVKLAWFAPSTTGYKQYLLKRTVRH